MKKIIANNLYMLKFIYKYCPGYMVWTVFVSLISSISGIVYILLIKYALDIALNQSMLNFYYILLGVLVFQTIYSGAIANYNFLKAPISSQIFQEKMYEDLFNKAVEVDLAKYDDPAFFNTYKMAIENSERRALAVLSSSITLIKSAFSIMLLIGILATVDVTILTFVILSVVISFFINVKLSKLSYEQNYEKVPQQRKASYIQRIFYLKDYAKEIRMSKISKALINVFRNSYNDLDSITRKFGRKQALLSALQGVLQVVVSIATIGYLMSKVSTAAITVGSFTMLYNGFQQLNTNASSLLSVIPSFYEHSLYIEHFKQFINTKSERPVHQSAELNDFVSLEFKNVSYKYSNNSKEALSNISFLVKQRQKIAIVGYNGAGKSTIAKLALNLYDPTEGAIYLNSRPIVDYPKQEINLGFGAIFQDFQMYSLTILENILMRPIKNRQEDEVMVINALKKVDMYDKIMRLTNGLDTHLSKELDENGAVFSGGEIQKLAIARLLVAPFNFIILDEPSSSLDAKSESEMFDLILDEYKDRTVIIISHRLANIRDVDYILYLHNGVVYESGSHDELMAKKGKYFELFTLQSKKYIKYQE